MLTRSFTRQIVGSAFTLGVLCALASTAQALTWTAPRLISSPEKPMWLVIRLDDVKVNEQRGLRASLAPRELLGQAGTDIPPVLNGAVIRLEPLDRNTIEMNIIGAAPLREPYLMFYVLLQWEGGQVLLPVSYTNSASTAVQRPAAPSATTPAVVVPAPSPAAPPPVSSATAPQAPVPSAEPAPSPAVSAPPAPAVSAPPAPAVSAPPAATPAVTKQEAPSLRSAPSLTDPGTEVEVKRGDTASELVQPFQDDTVNLNQMLIALLNKNPQAFVDGNVNRLQAGAKLRMPTTAEAGQISKAEARQQIKLQVEAFEAYKAGLSKKLDKVNQDPAKSSTSGDLVKQTDPKEPPQDKLKLNQADQKAADQKAAQGNAKQQEQSLAEAKKNLDELNKLADQIAKGPTTGSAKEGTTASDSSAPAPTTPAPAPSGDAKPDSTSGGVTSNQTAGDETLLELLSKEPSLYFIGAGLLGLLLIFAGRARRQAKGAVSSSAETSYVPPSAQGLGLPPDFNLELGTSDPQRINGMNNSELMNAVNSYSPSGSLPALDTDAQGSVSSLNEPTDSLSLESGEDEDPHLVRLKLASELWQLGQVHTSRALAQEVLEQGDEAAQEAARRWLQEHS